MTKVEIKKNKDGVYSGFKCSGHAGFDDAGYDIVCSAISMLVINTINSIEEFTEDKFTVETDERSGRIDFRFSSETVSHDATLLMNSMVLGLRGVQEEYGNKYITVEVK